MSQAVLSPLDLLDLVDFKWLMAGEGHGVHVERMQSDPAYAEQRLRVGVASKGETLRRCSARLLKLVEP
jgi:hypothetical protein